MTTNRTRQTALSGANLLSNPLFNKGTAFTEEERLGLRLLGLLPPQIETLATQVARAYEALKRKDDDLEKHIYLRQLQDENEVLFYRLLLEHTTEIMPLIYTPVVGEACQLFSHIYRRRRGLFISYPDRDHIEDIFDNYEYKDVDVIVVTDGERILGLGDQGAGGMGIPIGKLSLYSLCGGIDPAKTLPILLDAGTDNEELLKDPTYIGWRHERVRDEEYDQFVARFVDAVKKKFPKTLLQWEDFANRDARRLLDKYRDQLCTFNDDVQGTAAVAVAAVLAAVAASKSRIRDQQIVMFGAGSAGLGISDLLAQAMIDDGASPQEARDHIWLIDRPGLLHDRIADLQPAQKIYAKSYTKLQSEHGLTSEQIPLKDAVAIAKATVLIGTSAQSGAFTEEVVKTMAANCQRPIVLPLSNPTVKSEAQPSDVLGWTKGKAFVATGSPFAPVTIDGTTVVIGQCNNSYIFPGMGLGVVASGARRVTEGMFMAAAKSLAAQSPALENPAASLFPDLAIIRQVSLHIALAVGAAAQADGEAPASSADDLAKKTRDSMWVPDYATISRRIEGPIVSGARV
jgi:malate dehydrogenase (oxaloacetate-decarboxylating)